MPRYFAAFAVCALIMGLAGCSDGKKTTGDNGAVAKKTYTREEFRKLVDGKTTDEVKATFGVPVRTTDNGDDVYWYYENLTTDPVTGKVDSSAQVVFRGGKAIRVNY
jgi:outer membrane protein assembly factor BamE (lipoprotein component of BamABCDE complex)